MGGLRTDFKSPKLGAVNVQVKKFRGKFYLHIRDYYLTRAQMYLLSKRGVVLSVTGAERLTNSFDALHADKNVFGIFGMYD